MAISDWPAQERWKTENPVAVWCHGATRSAIRRGILERQPCEACGAEPADAHHPDHTQPLRVEWLCRRCHRRLHASQRRAMK